MLVTIRSARGTYALTQSLTFRHFSIEGQIGSTMSLGSLFLMNRSLSQEPDVLHARDEGYGLRGAVARYLNHEDFVVLHYPGERDPAAASQDEARVIWLQARQRDAVLLGRSELGNVIRVRIIANSVGRDLLVRLIVLIHDG